jgi:ABC-2 type transport system permease protein
MVAKLAAAVLVALLGGLLYVLVNGGLALPIYSGRGGTLPATGDIVSVYAGVVVSFALLCAFGLGIGAIVRNQVGAIIAAIAVFFVISALPELLPGSIGEYFPAQTVGTLHGRAEGDGTLTQVEGGLFLAAWSLALVAIGTVLICRRDLSE